MRSKKCVALLLFVASLVLVVSAGAQKTADQKPQKFSAKAAEKALPPHYKEWLQHDVVYLISDDEKQAFLRLATDDERDRYMEQWWELRNPTPGAPSNPFKEEVYKRISYANQWYRGTAGQEGWRTDRGRIYIILGKPKQVDRKPNAGSVRPLEVWFYDSEASPALPAYFYVMFYDQDGRGDYKLYSPYQDGPQKLITSYRAETDRVTAWHDIDREYGREIARVSLSLLPDEPVDYTTANSSLASDVLLSTIKNLANHPLTKQVIARKRALLESVTHRVILPGEYLNLFTLPLRDSAGNINLHYVLRVKKPEDFAVQRSGDEDRFYYAVDVNARVYTTEGKLIYSQEKQLSDYLSRGKMDRIKGSLFGYEGWLPLAPGKYKIDFILTNKLKQTAYKDERDIVVPDPSAGELRLTDVVPFSRVEPLQSGNPDVVPFSAAGVKFTPLVGDSLDFAIGQDIKFFYQIWAPRTGDARQNVGKKVAVDYAYGRPAASGDTKTIHDEVPKEQFDANGSEISGKKISLVDAVSGNYRLTVTAMDPETKQKAFSSMSFRVLGSVRPPDVWDIYDERNDDVTSGLADYQRGLVYFATGDKAHAEAWFRMAVTRNPSNQQFLAKLVDLAFARQGYADLAKIYPQINVNEKTDELTILRLAEALDKAGTPNRAIQLLESAVQTRQNSGTLYLTLASYYQRAGDAQKASDMQKKGKALMPAASPTT